MFEINDKCSKSLDLPFIQPFYKLAIEFLPVGMLPTLRRLIMKMKKC